MPKRKTLEEFIKEANLVHNSLYSYIKTNYVNTDTKVIIICPTHGEFSQTPHSHLNGKGCPTCGGSKKLTTEEFVHKANHIHNNFYTYDKSVYTTSGTYLTITCPMHGDFNQIPASHLSGKGCKRCAGITCIDDFITKAKHTHNDKYDYSKSVFVNANTKICITCRSHGDFYQLPRDHATKGHGCPSCSKAGFNPKKAGILYYLSIMGGTAYKLGITNLTVEKRFSAADLSKIQILRTWRFENGTECYQKEQELLKEYKKYLYTGDALLTSGNTELFYTDILHLDTPI